MIQKFTDIFKHACLRSVYLVNEAILHFSSFYDVIPTLICWSLLHPVCDLQAAHMKVQ